jgi:hypothetical protein
MRKLDARLGAAAGLHQLVRLTVVADLRIERADHRRVLHPLRELRQQLGNLHTRHIGCDLRERSAGRCPLLGVPGLQLARAAGQPQQDHPLLLPLEFLGKRRRAEDVEKRHVGRGGCGSEGGGLEETTARGNGTH